MADTILEVPSVLDMVRISVHVFGDLNDITLGYMPSIFRQGEDWCVFEHVPGDKNRADYPDRKMHRLEKGDFLVCASGNGESRVMKVIKRPEPNDPLATVKANVGQLQAMVADVAQKLSAISSDRNTSNRT